MQRLYRLAVVLFFLTLLSGLVLRSGPTPDRPAAERRFEFTYETSLRDLPAGAKRLDIWVPYPVSDDYQQVSEVRVDSPFKTTRTKDKEYGNTMLYVGVDNPSRTAAEIRMSFNVTRREHRMSQGPAAGRAAQDPLRARYLMPDALVPIDGKVKGMALEVTRGKGTPMEKARAIYDHTVSTLKYDKSGTGWGRGDIHYACDVRKGNCSDFHAVFIGFCRAVGIPAKFEIGFPLPEARGKGEIGGYHCWAHFYVDERGWVPVDSSEAAKNPGKREYFFGTHDENRVLFTRGRDIRLEPPQKGRPLNFFIYPYVEVDGKPFENVSKKFTFTDQ